LTSAIWPAKIILMKYVDFITAIRERLQYEIPDLPVEKEVCEKCGNDPHKGRCKQSRQQHFYNIDSLRKGSWSGSFIALLSPTHYNYSYLAWDDTSKPVVMLLLKWETGGRTGNCYNDEHTTYTSSEPEPAWEHFEGILEHFCPTIAYLQVRKLERLVIRDTYTDTGYYGDSTTYALKLLPLKTLWKFLNNNGHLGGIEQGDE